MCLLFSWARAWERNCWVAGRLSVTSPRACHTIPAAAAPLYTPPATFPFPHCLADTPYRLFSLLLGCSPLDTRQRLSLMPLLQAWVEVKSDTKGAAGMGGRCSEERQGTLWGTSSLVRECPLVLGLFSDRQRQPVFHGRCRRETCPVCFLECLSICWCGSSVN